MTNEQLKQEVWNTIQALNRAWTVEKSPEQLSDFFHNDIVAISGSARKRIEGKEACIAAWKSFVDNTQIHSWKEVDPTVQIYGNTSVVTYYYEIVFDMKGKRYNEGGRDMFVLVNEHGRWLAVANHFSSYPAE